MEIIKKIGGKNIKYSIISIIIVVLPFILGGKNSTITLLSMVGIYAIAALGYNLLLGYAGQISLGHAAFVGIGAYVTANLMKYMNFPFSISLIISLVIAGLFGVLLGIPALRLEGHYLAIATLGFGVVCEKIFAAWKGFTGGHSGLRGIPNINIFGFVIKSKLIKYYIILMILIIAVIAMKNIINSKYGRNLRAMRDSEIAAQSMGINIAKYKTVAFVISAVYAAAAGSLMAMYFNSVFYTSFNMNFSMNLLTIIVVGGIASVQGSILGAVYIVMIPEILKRLVPFDGIPFIINGALLIIVVLFYPMGLNKLVISAENYVKKLISKVKKEEVAS